MRSALRHAVDAELETRHKEQTGIFGIGSFLNGQRPLPLLLVDRDALPQSAGGARASFDQRPPFHDPNTFIPDLLSLLVPWRLVQSRVIPPDRRRPQLPTETMVLPVGRPRDMIAATSLPSGAPVQQSISRTIGTITAPALSPSGPGFLTAGHVMSPHQGASVRLMNAWPPRPIIGKVDEFQDPRWLSGQPGYDIALLSLNPEFSVPPHPTTGVVRPGETFRHPHLVDLIGGISGRRLGVVFGAAVMVGDSQRRWANCWLVMSLPGNWMNNGDSGAAVRTWPERQWLGTLVGGSRLGTGAYALNYVQDASSVMNEWLEPRGIAITREALTVDSDHPHT